MSEQLDLLAWGAPTAPPDGRLGPGETDAHHPISERFVWRGVTVDARYDPGFVGGHLAIHVIDPAPVQRPHGGQAFTMPCSDALPITDTGYRSHFMRDALVRAAGGPAAAVIALLEAAATENKAWAKRHAAGPELRL